MGRLSSPPTDRLEDGQHSPDQTYKGPWNAEEIAVISALYPDYRSILKSLPNRTFAAIKQRARILGLTSSKKPWTGAEVARLKRIYAVSSRDDILAQLPGSSWKRISAKAQRLGLRQHDGSPAPTGFRLIDIVRLRAFEHRITMRSLDRLAGTGQYFQRARWFCAKEEDADCLQKALRVLGGRFVIRWKS